MKLTQLSAFLVKLKRAKNRSFFYVELLATAAAVDADAIAINAAI